ncbi:unnamed protein product [Polarella glacialis]|uniref:Uncharacterized protein n=1 Tax=Polarella glacialis TaxID=89957 RepID=A0A813HZH7_POLGL|nr:unnamed protein product [Polarella glacialis]
MLGNRLCHGLLDEILDQDGIDLEAIAQAAEQDLQYRKKVLPNPEDPEDYPSENSSNRSYLTALVSQIGPQLEFVSSQGLRRFHAEKERVASQVRSPTASREGSPSGCFSGPPILFRAGSLLASQPGSPGSASGPPSLFQAGSLLASLPGVRVNSDVSLSQILCASGQRQHSQNAMPSLLLRGGPGSPASQGSPSGCFSGPPIEFAAGSFLASQPRHQGSLASQPDSRRPSDVSESHLGGNLGATVHQQPSRAAGGPGAPSSQRGNAPESAVIGRPRRQGWIPHLPWQVT